MNEKIREKTRMKLKIQTMMRFKEIQTDSVKGEGKESLGSFVRVVSANKKVRSQLEGVYNSTGNHLF